MLNEQEKVYAALLHSNITGLPIDPFKFRVTGYEWEIFSKFEAKKEGLFEREFLRNAAENYDAFTFEKGGKHFIIYEDKLATGERSADIYHEICHIIYGHTSHDSIVGKSNKKDAESAQEKEANYFSFIAPAPPCVLADEGIYDPDTISKITLVSLEHAAAIAAEVQRYRRTKKTKTEKELSKKFNTRWYRKKQAAKKIVFAVLALAVVASLAVRVGSSYRRVAETVMPIEETVEYVYITHSSEKFHRLSCMYVKGKDNLTKSTVDKALSSGYKPCAVCNPLIK